MARAYTPAALVLDLAHPARRPGDWEIMPEDLRALVRSGAILRHILRHPSARLLVEDLDAGVSARALLALRILTFGTASVEDRTGRVSRAGWRAIARGGLQWPQRLFDTRRTLRAADSALAALEVRRPMTRPASDRGAISGVLFLRADLARGAVAGGSIAHLVGVINELQKLLPVDVVTSDPIPLLAEGVRVACAKPEPRPRGDAEARLLQFNSTLLAAAEAATAGKPGRLVYQRYSVYNWTGAAIARRFGLPFVLEYNGPEVWVARHWARPLRYAELAERIERLNLAAADLVTVVSEPLRQHLLAQGIPDRRILVNPNGVDLERFTPNLDGAAVRARHGLEGRMVIGFIGTFGPWHGVEALAAAFVSLLARRPDLRGRARLLLIGDGVRLPAVRDLLRRGDRLDQAVLTGLVPQSEGPSYLAACDIFALPTVPNPDGSPFFGSPTKLFEYMGMGRAIVAARLGQAADVLDDEVSALLHAPGDAAALARALERLVDDGALRRRLGAAARKRAQERHSWSAHVARLVARLG